MMSKKALSNLLGKPKKKRSKRRNPASSALAVLGLSNPAGAIHINVRTVVNIQPNANTKQWALQVNPGNIISNSIYAQYLAMYTKLRVESYDFKVTYPGSSTNTTDQYAVWLCRDTVGQTLLSYSTICSQVGAQTRKLYQYVLMNWRPIEATDLNLANINQLTDNGIIYGATATSTPTVTPQVEIRLRVTFYANTFNSLADEPVVEAHDGVNRLKMFHHKIIRSDHPHWSEYQSIGQQEDFEEVQ